MENGLVENNILTILTNYLEKIMMGYLRVPFFFEMDITNVIMKYA